MVIVKTLNPDWFGTKKVIAAAGEVHPDKVSGQFEIAEEHLQEVLELYPDIVQADLQSISPAPTSSPAADLDPEKEEKIEGEDEDQENLQKNEEDGLNPEQETITGEATSTDAPEDLTAPLQEKTLKELQDLAKAFPRKEWGTLNKTELIQFLKNKLA